MMMRWLLAVLITGNLGYFSYHAWVETSLDADESGAAVSQIQQNPNVRPEGVKNITLLSEAVSRGEVLKIPDADREASAPVATEKLLCTQLGSFRARGAAEQVQQRLMAASIGSDIRQVRVPSAPDYWVYIPPLPNRDMAIRKLRELQANKIDSFIITEGDLTNGISLGLFTKRKLAEQLQGRRKGNGYDAQLQELERYRFEYWVEIRRADRDLFSKELWESIHDRYGFAEKHDNLCDSTVASPG